MHSADASFPKRNQNFSDQNITSPITPHIELMSKLVTNGFIQLSNIIPNKMPQFNKHGSDKEQSDSPVNMHLLTVNTKSVINI